MDSTNSISVLLTIGQRISKLPARRIFQSALMAGSLASSAGLLAACSDVPDAVNPVSWYEGVQGWFSDDEDQIPVPGKGATQAQAPQGQAQPQAKTAETSQVPGAEQSFPTLQSTPDKPMTTTVEQRRQMMQGLSADRANAHYADESARTAEAAPNPPAGQNGASGSAPAAPPSMAPAPPPSMAPPPPSMAGAGVSTPVAPAPAARGKKAYLSGADTAPATTAPTPPPAPPSLSVAGTAPATAPSAAAQQAPGVAPVTPPALGSSALDQAYANALQQSAPTVTTAPAGPTMAPPGTTSAAIAEPPEQPAKGKHGKGKSAKSSGPAPATPTTPSVQVFDEGYDGGYSGAGYSNANYSPYDGGYAPLPGQVGTIFFGRGSSALNDADQAKLRDVAALYRERGGFVRIVGHASSFTGDMDPMHHDMANFNVSMRRAEAVAAALVKHGVKRENISVDAASDSDPIYYEVMPAGEAGNQRAEIFIDY